MSRLPTCRVCIVLLAVLAPGCSRHPRPARRVEPAAAARRIELGRSVRGRPIEALVFDGGRGCVLILGGIHGSEPASSDLVERLARELENRPEARAGRRVVLIPRANPDGLAAATRTNANGVDCNRNFPAANFRASARHGRHALSEPESRAIHVALSRYQPSCVVSVHGPLDCIDPDGGTASSRLARRMAAASPLPFRDLRAEPGSLGSYAGVDSGLTMITYELDRCRIPPRNPARYLDPHLPALLLAIREG